MNLDSSRRSRATEYVIAVYENSPSSKYGDMLRHLEIDIPTRSDLRDLVISVPMFAESWLREYDDKRFREVFKRYFAGILDYYGENPARVNDGNSMVNAPLAGFRQMAAYIAIMKDLGEF